MKRQRYIALLRGINVGRAKRVAMAELRGLIEALGFHDVRTVLNSGNVVFDAAPLEPAAAAAAIEQALLATLGVAARVVVLEADALAIVMADNPLLAQASDPARLLVFILLDPLARAPLEALAARDWSPGALGLGRLAAYAWCPDGVLDSAAATALHKQLGTATTARNWSTLSKLHALCCEPS
jgi:uncharacterized protein (DUF1697 family)